MSESAAEHPANSRLVVRAALRTDVGLVRSENQDFGTYTTPDEEKDGHPGGRLLIVADGMGGHRGGATASRLAAETVKSQYLGAETTDIPRALLESLTRANARIFSEAQANPDLRGMGTTTSVLAIRGRLGWLAHVGDSRIYLVRGEEIRQLTQDHSLVASMVREGLLTPREAETHPRRNVLQRSMGVAEDVEIDVVGPIELHEHDTFILCSDGLHGVVKEDELRQIAQQSIEAAADELLRRALDRGAPDNVTVIVARIEQAEGEGAELGDETLTDLHHLDDTQPLEPMDFGEIVPDDAGAARASSPPSDPPPPEINEITQELPPLQLPATAPEPHPAPRKPRALLKWSVVLALILGAAGAWWYWNQQQQTLAAPTTTSSR
ncbi:MAG TPA: Stp1/IreP family PP2C-type Ser/Thr phosphatase [Thermoanaerobaculia bacterium]|jgi:protein phosphatase